MVVDFPSILTVRNDSEYLYKMANYSLKGRVTNFMGQWLGGTDGLPPAALSWSRGWAFGQAGPVAQLGLQPGLSSRRDLSHSKGCVVPLPFCCSLISFLMRAIKCVSPNE